ncbi:hypothetical protein [Thalassobellus citreus]|uniref:hypothetical protein n=1 Tax=Thalassobellus citreus TaxID=3367752 RepID=UPI00378AEFCE
MKRKQITTFIFFLLINIVAAYSQNVTVKYMAFYEHLEGTSMLRNSFFKSEATHIGTYFKLKNDLYNKSDNPINIKLDYHFADGLLFGTTNIETTIPKTKSETFVARSFGYDKAGIWKTGKYYVNASIKGYEIGSASFYITDGKVVREISEIKFFEGGEKAPEDKVFTNRFSRNNTRKVFTNIKFANPNYNKTDFTTDLTLKYFNPDGTLLGSPKLEFLVPKSWQVAILWNGYGYNESYSYWSPGNYRVEVWAGKNILTTGYFTIY